MNDQVEDKHDDEDVTINIYIDVVRMQWLDSFTRIDKSHGCDHRVPDTENDQNHNRYDRILIECSQIGDRGLTRETSDPC